MTIPTNEMATRIAPCRSPIPAPAASNNRARIQMVMPSIKTICRKKHAENCIKIPAVVSRFKIIARV